MHMYIYIYVKDCHPIQIIHRPPPQLPIARKDAGDLQEELTWAASRPESRWKTGVDSSSQREPPQLGDIMDDGSSVWEAYLTTSEQKFYQTYMAKFPNSCYSLNQDPDVTPMYARGQVT